MAKEINFEEYANKAPTDLQRRFPAWITEKTGYDPAGAKTKAEAFAEGVRLATALRMPFQASPENREATAERRRMRAAEAEAEAEETPAPRRATKATAAAEAPAAKPAGRGRRGAAKATAATSGSPF